MTGTFGSGCSFISENYIKPQGYSYIVLSDILKEYYKKEHNGQRANRQQLQEFGNELRLKEGADFLAKEALKTIENKHDQKWIIDSIRNPAEIEYLQNNLGKFYLISVFADPEQRWERVQADYSRDRRLFEKDEEKDSGKKEPPYGQKVTDCHLLADFIINNNEPIIGKNKNHELLNKKINRFLGLVEGEKTFSPESNETLMTIAYANSKRANCLKRNVGAIIADEYGNVISSGTNSVPILGSNCQEVFGNCYRDEQRNKIKDFLGRFISFEDKGTVNEFLKENFKILDYCRALHAEERAIINLIRAGPPSLQRAKLYTTTFPCNLCALKIIQINIPTVVFLEPYPQQESYQMLNDRGIYQEPFEGITFNGYFRF